MQRGQALLTEISARMTHSDLWVYETILTQFYLES